MPLAVPPGLGMDEVIASQISEQIVAGDWRVFYDAGQGREPVFNYWLAGWQTLLGPQVFSLRMASSTLSLLGLAATFSLIRAMLGSEVALLGLAFQATSFWSLFAARAGARSVALVPLAATGAYLFWRWLRRNHRTSRKFSWIAAIGSGILLGATQYTYTSSRVLPGVFLLFFVYLALFHRRKYLPQHDEIAAFAVVALLVTLPLVIYLQQHPQADQLGFSGFDGPVSALLAGDAQPVVENIGAVLGSFVVEGDPLLFNNVPGRPVFDWISGGCFLLGALISLGRWRQPPYAFLLLWTAVSLAPSILSQPAPNFYRMVAAQCTAFAFPAIALAEIAYRLQNSAGRSLAYVISSGVLITHLAGTYNAYFVQWTATESVDFYWQSDLAAIARYLDDSPDTNPVAVCTILTDERDPWWRPAWQSLDYLLQREDLAIRYFDCRTTLVLPDGQNVRYILPNTLATDASQSQVLQQIQTSPEVAHVPNSDCDAYHADAGSISFPILATSASSAPEAGSKTVSLPAGFGHSIALIGYEVTPSKPNIGETVEVVTQWEVIGKMLPQLTLFTHILSDPQTVIAQQDTLPITTQSLQPGDKFRVSHQITVPQLHNTGELLISIGLYRQDTLERLPITTGDHLVGDRLMLAPLSITD